MVFQSRLSKWGKHHDGIAVLRYPIELELLLELRELENPILTNYLKIIFFCNQYHIVAFRETIIH